MSKSRVIVLYAVTFALMIVFGMLPYVFLLPLLFVCVTSDWKVSTVSGLAFGVISLCYSFAGGSIVAVAFMQAPWIPIVPRVLVGVGTHFVYLGLSKVFREDSKFKRSLPYAIAGAVGSLLNTGLVIGCLVLFTPNATFGDTVMYVYAPYLLISGAIELAVNTLLLPPIAMTVKLALKRSGSTILESKK